jgi:chemotaxis protein methyltransferase WspC
MIYGKIQELLRKVMGLDVVSIGASAIERAVLTRMSTCKLDDTGRYWELLRNSLTELQELIEVVIVPETWFFRDREAFVTLARVAQEDGLSSHAAATLRLLSLPCSSGEEPYSMAMALLDAGLPPSRFRIDAVDISGQMLRRASSAVYGKNSFRSNDLAFRDRHFEKTAQGYQLSDAVRRYVHFQRGNLFDADFLPERDVYDVIFCRNLLIYFNQPDQERAVYVLHRLLKRGGTLFVAPSEAALLLTGDFVSLKVPGAFGFRKGREALCAEPFAPVASSQRPAAWSDITPRLRERKLPVATRAASTAENSQNIQETVIAAAGCGLEQVSSLANQGRLPEAAESCKGYLRKHGASVPALHLMGLIHAATGDLAEAARYYRQALYLEPNSHETLLHLSLLLEKSGDAAGLRVIRGRLQRLQTRSGAV